MNIIHSDNQPVRGEFYIRIFQILSVVYILFFPLKNFAQCITIDKGDYEIEVINSGNTYSLEVRFELADMDLNEFNIQLYNFDNASYYSDETGRNRLATNSGIILQKNRLLLKFSGVPEGDFGIILEKNGCGNQIIGYGYSGFPYSAIQIGI